MLSRPDHPVLRPGFTAADLQRLNMACVHLDQQAVEGTKNAWLKDLLDTRVQLTVPTAMMLLAALQHTDLATVTTTEIAAVGRQHYGLEIHALPFAHDTIPVYLAWHRAMEGDRGHQWFLEQIQSIW